MTAATPVNPATTATPGTTGTSTSGTDVNVSATMSSLDELKSKAPQVYNLMMQGIAQQICSDSETQTSKIIELIKEGEVQED